MPNSTNLVEAKEHGDTTVTHVHNCHNEDEDVELVETLQGDDWHLTLPKPRKMWEYYKNSQHYIFIWARIVRKVQISCNYDASIHKTKEGLILMYGNILLFLHDNYFASRSLGCDKFAEVPCKQQVICQWRLCHILEDNKNIRKLWCTNEKALLMMVLCQHFLISTWHFCALKVWDVVKLFKLLGMKLQAL